MDLFSNILQQALFSLVIEIRALMFLKRGHHSPQSCLFQEEPDKLSLEVGVVSKGESNQVTPHLISVLLHSESKPTIAPALPISPIFHS